MLFSLTALYGAAWIIKGFSFGNDITVLIIAAFVFGAVNSFIKPIFKLITLPLNLVTFGVSSLLVNTALLYLTVQIVPGLTVAPFRFSGLDVESQYLNLALPPCDIPAMGTFFLTSVVISLFVVVLEAILGR